MQQLHISPEKDTCAKFTFQELGIEKPACASSEIAGTAPFPLFTAESVPLIRKSLLNPRYINETSVIFGPKTLITRNTAAHSPFFRRLWTDPSVLRRLSQAAGIELEPVMETMELGHANIQVDFSKYVGLTKDEKLRMIAYDLTSGNYSKSGVSRRTVESRSFEMIQKAVDGQSLLPWHYDSYPWVCVAMVSDTSSMIGGETVIQRGDGTYVGISQPGMGSAMILQGGLVKHLALSSTSASNDRITLITSFRAKALGIYDSSFMSNIRPYSDLPELYRQWVDYRLDRLEPGIKKLHDKRRFLKVFDGQDVIEEDEQIVVLKEYAKRTLRQMVPPSAVRSLVGRLGCALFYDVRDDYVSGALFKLPLRPCRLCKISGAMVEKFHLSICPGRQRWRPENPIWDDCFETNRALNRNGVELRKRIEELQVADVVAKWKADPKGRPWGILDEFAVQGLGEYIVEFLELCGMDF